MCGSGAGLCSTGVGVVSCDNCASIDSPYQLYDELE